MEQISKKKKKYIDETLLSDVYQSGNIELIRYLIWLGGVPIKKTELGETSLFNAYKNGNIELES